ncbi:lytic transglycosylase domain-containing protein [Bosea caraganae]|uniref:Lytic transglycosylase domain-containing protein n=1 Tax=Bosea caraganae TaxID=2763117 RepID=A0A370LD28_9HYPH|nr:lytic transglycosylase domain-containing protein [Bosea caraganae]RDJ29425.1 lytic transglycosylase domain-containing protein [Bosea caraganae]
MTWQRPAALAAILTSTFSLTTPAAAQTVCEAHMIRASKAYDIPLGVLYSVGLTESGRKDSLQPYALNIHGRPFFGKSKEEALAEFNAARARGQKLIDIGCMQINHHYHRDQFPSLDAMFDPAQNVDYSAKFLKRLKARHETWTMAVARYHAGPHNNPAQQRYVCTVIRNMVATGFGQWTGNAKSFCGAKYAAL